ncbi:hypothetical protein COB55_01475 [Candidatus Wolfebacteria bacterium]|nr:MAG: hypothetical protein COB55_01475 [Candidatus Wolfebacteria bacterium]
MRELPQTKQAGVALLLSVIISSLLISIALSMIHIATKDVTLSVSGRESQLAFYAADMGMECALYWDIKQGVFATSTDSTPYIGTAECEGKDIFTIEIVDPLTSATAVTKFTLDYSDGRCSVVTVTKTDSSGRVTTKIESRGYNSCAVTDPRRVERAIRATY